MKLVENWKSIAARAHSMWAQYLALLCWVINVGAYQVFGVDTDPLIWGWLAVALSLYGTFGRVWDQRIDRSKTESPLVVALVVAVMCFALWTGENAEPVYSEQNAEVIRIEPAPSAAMPVTEAQFLVAAVPFIGEWEGLRLKAYKDVVGVWTVCYGETKGVKPGDSYTKAECDRMLAREVIAYRNGIHRYMNDQTKTTRLPRGRDVAFTSFAYNVGITGAGGSTAMRRLNGGNIEGACTAMTWWNKGRGRVIRGLVRRRTSEERLCLQGVV